MYGYSNYDKISFDLGKIDCFSEMVRARVKDLALSPAIDPRDRETFERAMRDIADVYQVQYYFDDNFIVNDIVHTSYTEGRLVILIYREDEVFDEYLKLKAIQQIYRARGGFTAAVRKENTKKLCKLLSYPPERIQEMYQNKY